MTAPTMTNHCVIYGMRGLGDTIYHRPFMRSMVRNGGEIWLRTAWPELFDDIEGLRLVRDTTRLRTQAKNIARNTRRLHHSDPSRRPGVKVIQAKYGISTPYRGIIPDLAEVFGVPFERDLFDLPRGGPSPILSDRPIALVRPVTVRSEWANPARNCLPQYIDNAVAILRERGFHVVSVADVLDRAEWFDGTPPQAETMLHHGELIFPRLMDLLRNAAVVVGPVGWIAPAAAAAKRPLILVGGGQGAWNNPNVIYSPEVDTSRVQWLLPDNYCMCCHVDHACEKTISDFPDKFRDALTRAQEQWHAPPPPLPVAEEQPVYPRTVSHVRVGDWAAHRGRFKLASLQRGDAGVSILVPRAYDDDPQRQRVWAWVKARYAALHPEWEIVEGFSVPQAWRKGEAVTDALSRAKGAVVIMADADCIVPPEALQEAVTQVQLGAPWCVPHGHVHRLTAEQTQAMLDTAPSTTTTLTPPPSATLDRPAYQGYAGGGLVVVGRSDFEAAGGIPRSFCGWGSEDQALEVILDTLLGAHRRLTYPLVHLWHPPQDKAMNRSNRPFYQKLLRYKNHPDSLWAQLHLDLTKVVAPVSPEEVRLADRQRRHAELRQAAVARQLAQQQSAATTPRALTDMQKRHRENIAIARARTSVRSTTPVPPQSTA